MLLKDRFDVAQVVHLRHGQQAARGPRIAGDEDELSIRGSGRDGLIILLDQERKAAKVWQFVKGLPVKWTGPAMNATQNQVAIEEIEIAHQGLKLMSASLSVSLGDIADATSDVVSSVKGLF